MVNTENWMAIIAFPYANTLLAICCKNARNTNHWMSSIISKYDGLRLKTESDRTFRHFQKSLEVRPHLTAIN